MRIDDLIITVAYFSIPAQIVISLVHCPRRASMPLRILAPLVLFALFNALCGVGHLIRAGNMNRDCLIFVNGLTAFISLLMVAWLLPLIPSVMNTIDENLHTTEESKHKQRAFMAFLCHEIRSPLSSITSAIAFLEDEQMTPEQKTSLSSISQSTNLMLRLINDVLDLCELESGKLELEVRDFDLRSLLQSVSRTAYSQVRQKRHGRVEFGFTMTPDVPEVICGDSVRLLQIVCNLLSNAAKFTEKGRIDLSIATFGFQEAVSKRFITTGKSPLVDETSTESSEDFEMGLLQGAEEGRSHASSSDYNTVVLRMQISDTGSGIAKERLERIFEPYSLSKMSDYRKHGGTGLGLSIVSKLLHSMGGTIQVSSHVGEGSTFTIYLPVRVPKYPNLVQDGESDNVKDSLGYSRFPEILATVADAESGDAGYKDAILEATNREVSEEPPSPGTPPVPKPTSAPLPSSTPTVPPPPTLPPPPSPPVTSPGLSTPSKFDFPPNEKVVVDDNMVNRKLLGRMLAHFNIEQHQACDGREACDAIMKARNVTGDRHAPEYGVILMDTCSLFHHHMTMITADDRATNPNAATASSSQAIPCCVCDWKNCHLYQKAFRESRHPFWDGVIKLRFVQGDAESMALKAAIDRQLKVERAKRNDFKNLKGAEVCRYAIARHHFTQKHIQKYLSSDHYSFVKPFTLHGAQKYLYAIDDFDTLQNDKVEIFYVQVPNNSKETVKAHFQQLKENLEQQSQGSSNHEIDANTVVTERSNLLVKKEAENAKLKDQLEAMQSQLTFLHDMVKKLQEDHLDNKSVSNRSSKQQQPQQRFPRGNSAHSRSRRTMSSRSGRSGVPTELEFGADEVGSQYDPDWSEHYEEDGSTVATFHASYRAQRRSSIRDQSAAQSFVSMTSRTASIASASKDDCESHESVQEEARENRITASNWRGTASVHEDVDDGDEDVDAEKYDYGPTAMGSGQNSVGPNRRKPTRRTSLEHSGQQRRSSLSSHLAKSTDGSIVSGKDNEDNQTDISSLTAGTYQVQALVVTDPYGEQGIYTGTISASTNMPHGYGRLQYDRAGWWYEGDWKHGRWTGNGRLSNGDGDFYEGALKNDHKHGFGVMKFPDGCIFEGEYINGQMIQGTITYQDGSTYTGSWVDGMRHGQGLCVFADQSVYEGEFREGEFFGHGKLTWSDGGWYEGAWVNGEMDGFGKEVRPDGSLRHEGEWRKGQPVRRPRM